MDFSFLSQPAQLQLPDPTAMAVRGQTLANLAQQNQEGSLRLQAMQDAQDIKTAAAKVFGDAQSMGWDAALRKAVADGNQRGAAAALQLRREDEAGQAKVNVDLATANEKNATAVEKDFLRRQKGLGDIANAAAEQARTGRVDLGYLKGMADFYKLSIPPIPDGADPAAYVANLASSAISAKDRMENDTTQRGQTLTSDTTRRGQDMTSATAAGEQAVQRRGQDMTAGTAANRLSFDRSQSGGLQSVSDGQGGLYAFDKQNGTYKAATGPDGQPLPRTDKPLTEVQGNATAFGMRMQAANNIFSGLEKSGFDPGTLPNAYLPANKLGNYIADPKAQEAYQAKLNFMTASLRKESGAAISQSEFDSEDRKYFPQPGDSSAVREQKAAMRQLALKAMSIQAGPGAKNIAPQADAPQKPRLGEVRKGYMYKGGDPAAPDSWEKAS